jgi:hypothetical protein
LPEAVAAQLLDALLCDCPSQRCQRLLALLREDAALTLWCVCRAEQLGASPPNSISDVAAWLAEEAVSVLQWTDDELVDAAERTQPAIAAERFESDDSWQGSIDRWAGLTRSAVAVAHLAAQRAPSSVPADLVFLGGLLHGAVDWLSSSGPAVLQANLPSCEHCLPTWLVTFLEEIAQPAANATAELIRQCIDDVRRSAMDDARDDRLESAALAPSLRAGQRWMEIRGYVGDARFSAGRSLPRLFRKLARLRDLETDFQATLLIEKLASMKELAYGASHEINNPLANISARAQALLRDEADPERRRKLATMNSQALRAHDMISNMMLFAKPPQIHPQHVELDRLIDEVIAELQPPANEQGTTLVRSGGQNLEVWADPVQLAVALKALAQNSFDALGCGGRVEITTESSAPAMGQRGWVEIRVRDTGPGIGADVRRHLFDPFYSGREAGRGLGFGLSKCWQIVTQHEGRISVQSEPGYGATFTIRLPGKLPIPAALRAVA